MLIAADNQIRHSQNPVFSTLWALNKFSIICNAKFPFVHSPLTVLYSLCKTSDLLIGKNLEKVILEGLHRRNYQRELERTGPKRGREMFLTINGGCRPGMPGARGSQPWLTMRIIWEVFNKYWCRGPTPATFGNWTFIFFKSFPSDPHM